MPDHLGRVRLRGKRRASRRTRLCVVE